MAGLRLEPPSRTPAPLAQTDDSAHNSRPVPRTATKFSCPHCKSDLSALAADPVLAPHTKWIRVQSRLKDVYSIWRKMQRKVIAVTNLQLSAAAPSTVPDPR